METEAQLRYRQSKMGKAKRKEYQQSDRYKAATKKYRQSIKGRAKIKEYRQSVKGKAMMKKYREKHRKTIKGYLGVVHHHIKQRCENSKCLIYRWYGACGIKNKFKSLDGFRDYVTNELGYDTYEKIKGLQIHRIDNDGHYERGNIRFVTREEHRKLHVKGTR